MEILVTVAGVGLAGYAGFVVLVTLVQRRLQYFPASHPPEALELTPEPGDRGAPPFEDLAIETADGETLRAWFRPPRTGRTVLLIFHGNAGHRGHRLWWLAVLGTLGCGVLILDYRGYGGSTGRPTERGLGLDARAARQWLEGQGWGDSVVYVGESLGCAVAVELAAQYPPQGLILHSGFESAVAIGRRAYPFLPVGWLMRDRYEVLPIALRVSTPVLTLHGSDDRVVPIDSGRTLHEAFAGPKRFVEIPGAGHDDLPFVDARLYLDELRRFLDAVEGKSCGLGEERPSEGGG